MSKHDELSVMGAGGGHAPMPTKSDAEIAWRELYVARMVQRGIRPLDAQACCNAVAVDLSDDPAQAADDEMDCWEDDGDIP